MEIRNLISFVQVADLNSFTKAAEALGYSQSTISFQIKQLENELDCLLFERINHKIVLTQKGAELLEYAKEIRQLTDEFSENWRAPEQVKGFLHLVTPDSVCEDMMLHNYEDFHKSNPGIRLKFSSADTDDMFRILDRNEADLMLTLDKHVYQKDYVIAKEEPVAMHFVTGVCSPYATKRALTLGETAEFPWLLTEKGMGYRRALDEACAKRSIELSPILELGRTDVIIDVLERGIGVSFLPDFVTQQAVEAGKLCYLQVKDVKVDVWKQLIYHKNKWMSKALLALIEYIKLHEFSL